MAREDTHRLGYQRVDDDPNVDVLVAAMQGTAGWDATRRLRSWERAHLGLAGGERLLDVGCGLGEAALELAEDLGDDGEVVGIDASEQMLRVARSNAAAVRCRVRFTVGDASALDEPDDSFDAARCERTLQWLADPAAAVAELVRVVRPGGRLSLIDTDWSTFAIDVGDPAIAAIIRERMRTERGRAIQRRPATARPRGGGWLCPAREHRGDPDLDDLGPRRVAGTPWCFSMESLADDLVGTDGFATADRERFVSTIHDAARRGRFSMRLTMFAVVAAVPSAHGGRDAAVIRRWASSSSS